MKKTALISFWMIIISCSPSRYFLTTREGLKNEISTYGKLPTKRYLISPNEYSDQDLSFINSEPSKTVIFHLKNGNFRKAQKILEQTDQTDDMSYIFASSLMNLFEGKYDSCKVYIHKMDKYSKNCFIQFISNDCDYERDRVTGNANYKKYLEKYQILLDCASDDELHKELVKMRLKLIRYGY